MASKKSNNNTGIYIAAFFLCVILLIMLFFVKKDNIVSNLKKTNFFERVGVSTPEFVSNHQQEQKIPQVEEKYEFNLMDDSTKTTTLTPAVSNNSEVCESKSSLSVIITIVGLLKVSFSLNINFLDKNNIA